MESMTTSELTRLPGLEVAESKPEVRPEHWIERGPSKRLMLFSGRSHPDLAHHLHPLQFADRPLSVGIDCIGQLKRELGYDQAKHEAEQREEPLEVAHCPSRNEHDR